MSGILGINKRCYPSQMRLDSYVEITVVLVEGVIGDYAAYIGEGSPEFVRDMGNKISFAEAQLHFPSIEEEKYRR